MPWSSISSSASVPERSGATVHAGALITSEIGVSGPAPSATTRVRRSRSVTMPSRSPRSTSTQVAPGSTIRRAASWTPVSGGQDECGGADQLAHRPAAGRGHGRLLACVSAGARPWPSSGPRSARPPGARAPAGSPARESGRRACPRRRAPRSRAARPAAATRRRTSPPRRAGRGAVRPRAARPSRGARHRRSARSPRRFPGSPSPRRRTRSRPSRHTLERLLVERVERRMPRPGTGRCRA